MRESPSFMDRVREAPTLVKVILPASVVILVIAAIAGGGGESGPSAEEEREEREAERAAELEAEREAEAAASAACQEALAPLLDELTELNSRLAVGVQFADYTTYIGDARVAYDQVLRSDLPPDCLLSTGIQAEKALNIYIEASNDWNDCIQDFGCDVDSLDLSSQWAKARRLVDRASEGP